MKTFVIALQRKKKDAALIFSLVWMSCSTAKITEIELKTMKCMFRHFKGSFRHSNHTAVNLFFFLIYISLKLLTASHKIQERNCLKLMYQSSEAHQFP